jgi:hypothetical protein
MTRWEPGFQERYFMLKFVGSFFTATLLVGLPTTVRAQDAEASEGLVVESGTNPLQSFLRIGELSKSAADLRAASESAERLGESAGGIAEHIAASLARMSSEFDPFGYKTAFRTLNQQANSMMQLQAKIELLQNREMQRVKAENRKLRKAIREMRDAATSEIDP